ncbi:hypothetical protein BHE74_00019571, partial [Ensete ventricosum]
GHRLAGAVISAAGAAYAHDSHCHCWRASLLCAVAVAFTSGQSHDHRLCVTAAYTWTLPKCDLCSQAATLYSGATTTTAA